MYTQANKNLNQILGIKKPTKVNEFKTNGQLMYERFPIGTKLVYQGKEAEVTGFERDDATPLAHIVVRESWLSREFTARLTYNELVFSVTR